MIEDARNEGLAQGFSKEEHCKRLQRIQTALRRRNVNALLAFQPETVTWLTGFLTTGYTSFQFAVVPASGEPTVVLRDLEHYYFERTSVFPGHVLWSDGEDVDEVAAAAIRRAVAADGRFAVEMDAWPFTAARFRAICEKLPRAVFVDAEGLATRLRFVKSPAEIALMRQAGKAAEAGMAAAVSASRESASERDIATAACAAMIATGSDIAGPGVLSSGERALHLHGSFTDRRLVRGDTVQFEASPCVRHYHVRFMRPIKIGAVSDEERSLTDRLVAIQDQALAEVAAGVAAVVPDRIYRDGLRSAGLVDRYPNKTFYSVGLLLPPSGGETLEATPCGYSKLDPANLC